VADGIQFNLTGLDSLLGKFESIKYDVKRKGGRSALRKAAMLVVQSAKENARSLDDAETGRSIADNVALRWDGKRFKSTGDLGFRVGILHGAVLKNGGDKSKNAPTPHWRLLEFGTEKMPANPFFRRALSDNISAVTDKFLTEYEKAIDRAIKRAAKKAGV
jgi:HK97 gp10 family phage protein